MPTLRPGRHGSQRVLAAGLLGLALLGGGCAQVRPWERGALSDRRMQWAPDSDRASARLHVLTVREGATGAQGRAGAACGCN